MACELRREEAGPLKIWLDCIRFLNATTAFCQE
jgi:hypothetical protein